MRDLKIKHLPGDPEPPQAVLRTSNGHEIEVRCWADADLSHRYARRIAACVNACAGAPAGTLESGALDTVSLVRRIKQQVPPAVVAKMAAALMHYAYHSHDAAPAVEALEAYEAASKGGAE